MCYSCSWIYSLNLWLLLSVVCWYISLHLLCQSFAGLCGALLIGIGVVGAAIAGILVDKTKKFEEVTKVCYALAAVSATFFAIVSYNFLQCQPVTYIHVRASLYMLLCSLCFQISGYRDQEILVGLAISLFGFFGFAIYPLCLELSVECAYPVAEATTAGFLLMSGYFSFYRMIYCCTFYDC